MRSMPRLRVVGRLTTTGNGATHMTFHVGPGMNTRARTGVAAKLTRGGFKVDVRSVSGIVSVTKALPRMGFMNLRFRVNSRVLSVNSFMTLYGHMGRLRRGLCTHRVVMRRVGMNNKLKVSCTRPGHRTVPGFARCFTACRGRLGLHPRRALRFRLKHTMMKRYNDLVDGIVCMGRKAGGRFTVLSTNVASLVHPTLCRTCRGVRGVASRRPVRACSIMNPVYRSSSMFNGTVSLGGTRHNSLFTLHSTKTCNRVVTSTCGYHTLPGKCASRRLMWAGSGYLGGWRATPL